MRDVKGGNVEGPPLQPVYTFESVGQEDTSKRRNITGMTVNSTRDSNKPSPLSLYLDKRGEVGKIRDLFPSVINDSRGINSSSFRTVPLPVSGCNDPPNCGYDSISNFSSGR